MVPENIDDKFNAILKRMLQSPPLSKEEISARIKVEREAKREAAGNAAKKPLEKNRKYRSKV